jgi:hypothetical protein
MEQQNQDILNDILSTYTTDLNGSLQITYDIEHAKSSYPYLFKEPIDCTCNDEHCPHKSSINSFALIGLKDYYTMNIDLIPYLNEYDWESAEPEFHIDVTNTNYISHHDHLDKLHINEPTVCQYDLMVNEGDVCRVELVIISCKFPNDMDIDSVAFRFSSGVENSSLKYDAQYKDDWWVFEAPLIIKRLYFTHAHLYVNGERYNGNVSTKWISFPNYKFKDNQTYIQHLGDNKYMSYYQGICMLHSTL